MPSENSSRRRWKRLPESKDRMSTFTLPTDPDAGFMKVKRRR
jgi:hypothetical protein